MSRPKNLVTRYATVMISIISIWLYVVVVNETLGIIDIPVPATGIVLAVLIVVAHKSLVKNKADKDILDKSPDNLVFAKVFFGTLGGIILAILLSYATITIADEDARREFSSLTTTCTRDSSQIKMLPVDTSATLPEGAKVTVHNVAYNVPQRSERPEETNAWYCAKATLVEVTVENIPPAGSDNELKTYNFTLQSFEPHTSSELSKIVRESDDDLYQTDLLGKGKLPMLELKFLPEGVTTSRGWLVYTVAEDTDNKGSKLLYNDSMRIDLPTPR